MPSRCKPYLIARVLQIPPSVSHPSCRVPHFSPWREAARTRRLRADKTLPVHCAPSTHVAHRESLIRLAHSKNHGSPIVLGNLVVVQPLLGTATSESEHMLSQVAPPMPELFASPADSSHPADAAANARPRFTAAHATTITYSAANTSRSALQKTPQSRSSLRARWALFIRHLRLRRGSRSVSCVQAHADDIRSRLRMAPCTGSHRPVLQTIPGL